MATTCNCTRHCQETRAFPQPEKPDEAGGERAETLYFYDLTGRRTRTIFAATTMDLNDNETPVADPTVTIEDTCTYLNGTNRKATCTRAGETTSYAYDYRHRLKEETVQPKVGTSLTNKSVYLDNQLFYTEDPYGRRTYYAYSVSDGSLIRQIQTTVPGVTFADFNDVLNEVRDPDATPNSTTLVTDYINDGDQITETIDPRGIHHTVAYDSRGQRVEETQAAGSAVAAKTVTVYDANGNAIEVQHPRHFDANDPVFGNCKTTMTYTGRNRLKTRTEAAGTAAEATESLTYTLDGKQATRTDFRGNQWQWIWQQCCGRQPATMDPLGHGTITNTDAEGNVTHTATVEDVQSHVNVNDPTDAKTLNEITTRYDERNRPIARTVWLTPRGTVDPKNPPIAGENGIASTDGLTTRMQYDDNLTDGVGLDADFAQHMADLGLGTDSDGSATLTTSPEGRRTLSVSDGLGRTVRTTQLDSTGAALTSNTTTHDTIVAVAGYGDCLETSVANALGHTNRRRTDGEGRTIQAVDAENFITQFTFDGNGNRLSVHDPNNVGDDCTYNERNRRVRCADTQEQIEHVNRQWVYDAQGNVIQQIDAKGNATLSAYDARGRRTSTTDRLGEATAFAYDPNGNQLSLTDAENQTTSYEYDTANRKVKETYPDHVAGTQAGDQGYGIREFAYDAAGRLSVATDQLGDYITHIYDMANRRAAREYRERVKQSSDPPNDTDRFTFDGEGKILTAAKGRYNNTVTFSHDEAGRLASELLTIDGNTYTVTHSFDQAGRQVSTMYPDGSLVSRAFTNRGQLEQVDYDGDGAGGGPQSLVASFQYDPGHRETQRTHGNGIVTNRTYTRSDNLVTSIDVPGYPGLSFAYTCDENKNITSETTGGVMAGYSFTAGYDDEDRLASWNRNNGDSQSWTLTPVGDWQQFTEDGVVQNRTHGPTHELTAIDTQPLTYDAKGNLLSTQDSGLTTPTRGTWTTCSPRPRSRPAAAEA